MKSGIYIWKNLKTSRALIGQTQDFEKRKSQYITDLKRNAYGNTHFQRSWTKHGEENFRFEILEEVSNPAFLTAYEQSYLDYYRKLPGGVYNQVGPVDNPNRGRKTSEETKTKQSLAKKGKPSPRKGVTLSAETIARISSSKTGSTTSRKGTKLSKEHCDALSKGQKGKQLTPEHIQKIIKNLNWYQNKKDI